MATKLPPPFSRYPFPPPPSEDLFFLPTRRSAILPPFPADLAAIFSQGPLSLPPLTIARANLKASSRPGLKRNPSPFFPLLPFYFKPNNGLPPSLWDSWIFFPLPSIGVAPLKEFAEGTSPSLMGEVPRADSKAGFIIFSFSELSRRSSAFPMYSARSASPFEAEETLDLFPLSPPSLLTLDPASPPPFSPREPFRRDMLKNYPPFATIRIRPPLVPITPPPFLLKSPSLCV